MPRLLSDVVPAGTFARHDQPVLTTARGRVLRLWRADDASVLVAAYADPAIQRWHHRRWTADEALAWIDEAAQRWRSETGAEWAVTDADDRVVGRVALHDANLSVGQGAVSYWTVPAARGQGTAVDAVDTVARWDLDEVGFWRLEVRHSTANTPSCRVATGAGFVHEATLARQHLHDDGWHDVHVHSRHRERPATGDEQTPEVAAGEAAPTVTLRAQRLDDADHLVALARRSWGAVEASIDAHLGSPLDRLVTPSWPAHHAEVVGAACADPATDVTVAVDEHGHRVGFVAVRAHPATEGMRAYGEVVVLGVAPDARRQGVGRRLLAAGLARLVEQDLEVVVVETGGDAGHGPARALYEGAGFRRLPLAQYWRSLP